jgi:hypothetical protein
MEIPETALSFEKLIEGGVEGIHAPVENLEG